jgi:hypothetical protein
MKRKKINPKVYDLRSYDLAYVVLKPSSLLFKEYEDVVNFDTLKKKHYITGKLITLERINLNTSSMIQYPKFRTVSMVPAKSIEAYNMTLKEEYKEQYIIHIHFSVIDCITLPFDAFDWKK